MLPASASWEFGGHPYGLEPLALPPKWLPRTPPADAELINAVHQRLAAGVETTGLTPVGDVEIDRVFWFRWITGHQASFLMWQMLSAVLDEITSADVDQEELADQARLLVRGFSLMLLYTSSPPREIYQRVIRLPMARQHPNLSGSWAVDYTSMRQLVRGKIELGTGPAAAALRDECRLYEQVHDGIAFKVLPAGGSLLQEANAGSGPWRMRRRSLTWLYDSIFLTTRMAVSADIVTRQLVRRLHAIVLDLSTGGLLPWYAPSAEDNPPALRSPEVAALAKSAISDLLRIIRLAGSGVPVPAGAR
ncbi:hypothetical protein [Actinoplanes siamensis]|uniref:hypothetical protein n=1 Tax=Actinoplanes siamensis TaxID=1223317 RepID=UPI001943D376|nr:hypothetical protein [Actinoplanes siamensis]